jgi:hypothetical protein
LKPNPKEDTGPPFTDLMGVIKEARRHRNAFQKLPLRKERLRQLYWLRDQLHFLTVSNPEGTKPMADGRSPIPLDDLLLTKAAGPDFDPLRPRNFHPTKSHHDDDERTANIERQYAIIRTHYDLWTNTQELKEIGFDASMIDMLNTENNPNQRSKLLFELIKREIDLLEPDPWILPEGLQYDKGLIWANVIELNEKISAAENTRPFLSAVRHDLAPNTEKLDSEKRIIDRSVTRLKLATGAANSLYMSLRKEIVINRQAFDYYGAGHEFDQLRVPATSQEGVIVLTACIVAARKKRGGRLTYEQDSDLCRAVLRHVRKVI